MPRKPELSWEESPRHRWSIMLNGQRYRITCRQLGLPREQWTKDASYQAANAWWECQHAELQTNRLALRPHNDRLVELEGRKALALSLGMTDEAEQVTAEIDRVGKLYPDEDPRIDPERAERLELAERLGILHEPGVIDSLASDEKVWADRQERAARVQQDKTIGALVSRWVAARQDEAQKRVRSYENADAARRALAHFEEFVGMSNPVDVLKADLWHSWYVHCAAQVALRNEENEKDGWSADTASKYFSTAKTFVRWLWQQELLPALPRNLDDKAHRFERAQREIPTFSNDELKLLLATANGVHRLILLLMLNCGMTQKDVADLRCKQVDLDKGRITRRRSKTKKKKSSRLVSYKLWPEVIALLRLHMANDGERALVTKSGKPWVWTKIANGKLQKSDNVATIFNNLKAEVNMRGEGKSVKVFRKTSATRIRASKDHRDLRYLFLGHSERTIADRHYAEASQESLDACTDWLRSQYPIPTE